MRHIYVGLVLTLTGNSPTFTWLFLSKRWFLAQQDAAFCPGILG